MSTGMLLSLGLVLGTAAAIFLLGRETGRAGAELRELRHLNRAIRTARGLSRDGLDVEYLPVDGYGWTELEIRQMTAAGEDQIGPVRP